MIDWADIERALPTFRPVEGGFSSARRGIVTLVDGRTVFVKLGVDDRTKRWARNEIKAYHWLEDAGYQHAPRLVAQSDEGFALPDLSTWDWEHVWHKDKVDAALLALDRLAGLPATTGHFEQSGFEADGNPWRNLPADAAAYRSIVDGDTWQELADLLTDSSLRLEYAQAAEGRPWYGDDLVHYDARADNFAYDHSSKHGCFVDWNWMSLGNSAFDRTAMLVNVQLSGFDVLPDYHDQVDRNSLIWLMGFWLERALGPQETEGQQRLRPRQVANALQAHQLLVRL